ncbi:MULTISPECIES: DNRLRE domain-containing protein [Sporosarcina]|uniref:DNRLRE domain-containing protein n=1 Tax=Sporosarcina gallistercoris TaxID=2762245 RepID=A0ABR8PFY3_9BACL|nr:MULTISPECIES: DNRLRE domain-containing protein [Sporosarcina]MBD7906999.1 DNRLRE domain-containing protein [Sporosarcina gallistercoris]VDG98657.1 Cell wall-associated polypeptide CWBP200 [Lysinibacillus sphaericus]
MRKKLKKRGHKWLSSLIVLAMLMSYAPFSEFAFAYGETNSEDNYQTKLKDKQSKKEVIEKRTENSKTFLNADGTYTAQISQIPLHFKNGKNEWEEINNELVTDSSKNVYQNKANAFTVEFDQKQTPDTPYIQIKEEQHLAELQLEPLEHTKEEPASVKGIVAEDSITYPDVYKNIDIKYTVGADRIKEDIIYNEKPQKGFPERFTYKMNLEGMVVKEVGDTLYLYSKDTNEQLYYFEAPYMYDSYIPKEFKEATEIESIPEESISYNVELKHEIINNELFLYLIPNKEWLEEPNRSYPITIDPTIVRLQSTPYVEDTNLRSGFSTQTGGNDLELGGGTSSNNTLRSLLKFDLSSIPKSTTILSSSLNLWFSSTNNSAPIDISLFKLTTDWEENQASWTYSKTIPSTAWTNKGGDYVTSNKLSTVRNLTSPSSLDNEMKKWDFPIHIIQEWKNKPETNFGFLLKSDNEATNIYKKFVASENTVNQKYKPLLVITYRTNARLGLEEYWPYTSYPLIGGTSYSNLTTGNNIIQYNDFSIMGRGEFNFSFARTYNSKSSEQSVMGRGWTFTGNEKLFLNIKGTANIINYQDEDGTDHEFNYDGPTATYYSGPGRYESIKKTGTDFYTLKDTDGIETFFKIRESNQDTVVKIAYIENQIDRHGNKINYGYDSSNRLITISTDLGNNLNKLLRFTYNSDGYIETATYEGIKFTYMYNSDGTVKNVDELKDITTGTSIKSSFEYEDGMISAVIDPNGRRTDYNYENGFLVKVQEPQEINGVKDPLDRPGTEYSLDTKNKIAKVKDPNGYQTTYYTNDNYVVERKVDDAGLETIYTLNANYDVLTEKKAGLLTKNTYDTNGNLLSTTDPEGNIQRFKYTTYNNIEVEIDSNNKTITRTYYKNGDLKTLEITDAIADNGRLITTYNYNVYGDLESVIYPNGTKDTILIDYVSSIKTTKSTDDFGSTSILKTDLKGNLLQTKNGPKEPFSYSYNLRGEIEKVIDPMFGETGYQYDSNGNIRNIINAKNFVTKYEYNGQNLLTKETNSINKITNYKYDANSNLIEVILPNNQIIRSSYDNLNRITNIYSNGIPSWKYSYEGDRLSSIYRGTTISKQFLYYDNDSIKSIQEGNNLLEYSYLGDEYNSQLKYTVGSNPSTTLEFIPDDVYRTKELKRNNSTAASFQYNQDGSPKMISYPNGSSISMGYDRNRLINYTIKNNDGNTVDTYIYEYDEIHSIKKIHSNAGTTIYDYDEQNQLISEQLTNGTVISYKYDKAGNRETKQTTKNGTTTTVVYNYNADNQIIKAEDQEYQYDEIGNLKWDGKRSYRFNNFNELEEIKDLSGKTIATYTYDEEGKRISSNTADGQIYYIYDGDKVLYETDGNNQLLREYMYDDNGNPLTMSYKGQTYYYLFNQHGDVIALTDKSGAVVASYTYDAWGNILSQNGIMATINPYRYSGYRFDEGTNLYYLVARYYNSDTGSFLSRDPVQGDLQNPVTLNGYNYADNNPVMLSDSDGENPLIIVLIYVGGRQVVKKVAKSLLKKSMKDATKALKNQMKKKSLGRGSTGRTTPNNLEEQLAMKEILSNPLKGAKEVVGKKKMNDKRWPGSEGWVKMQRTIKTGKKGTINIHFNYNIKTGKFDDFKFK